MDTIQAMKLNNVGSDENYYDATAPRYREDRARLADNFDKLFQRDKDHTNLMNIGFQRRAYGSAGVDMLHKSAEKVGAAFDVGKSKKDQMQDLYDARARLRPSWARLIPDSLVQYYDFLAFLQKTPRKKDLMRNYFLGAFFSFVVWFNASARSSFMYCVVGNLTLLSAMLGRGSGGAMPKPGEPKRAAASWSAGSFKMAGAIQALFSLGAAALALLVSSVVPGMPRGIAAKLAMSASLASGAHYTAQYEVFEPKGRSGQRWKKFTENTEAMDESALEDQRMRYSKTDKYDYDYDPMIDDYPYQNKYIDEDIEEEASMGGAGAGVDDEQQAEDFQNWQAARKLSRAPPVTDVAPETPWVGSKKGMYIKKVPQWLDKAYQRNVLQANRWRDKESVYKKDYTEFEPVAGPPGFRDKRPDWLDLFGTGVWQAKTTASRKAARKYGTYRKSMQKIDKEVVLQPCDEGSG
jgi:hypothetical protein